MKQNIKQNIAIISSFLTLCLSTGCGYQIKKITAEEVSAGYTRQATDSGKLTDEFKTSMANFSVQLLQKTLTKDSQNELISPLSATQCLSLITNGAHGNTLSQLEALFGMSIDELNRATYAYTSSLYSAKDCQVRLANSIWVREDLAVRESFLQTNADWYNAQTYLTPFNNTTLRDINHWCSNQTQGKIDKILDKIEEESVMYLINALYFDAKWNVKYEKEDVKDYTFNNYGGDKTTVDMLYSNEYTYLQDSEIAIGFAKPYKENKYSFVGILPNEDANIYEYINDLTGERWIEMWKNKQSHLVKARFPEFSYEREMLLNNTLKALGVSDMFNPHQADFSKISETTELYCDFIKQKTYIDVSRNGTKAAAITMGGMKGNSALSPDEVIYITLDRPFVYAIVDNANGLPLFLGAVTNL